MKACSCGFICNDFLSFDKRDASYRRADHLQLQAVWYGIIFVQENNQSPPLCNDIACQSQFSAGDSAFLARCRGVNNQQDNLGSVEAALSQRLSRLC